MEKRFPILGEIIYDAIDDSEATKNKIDLVPKRTRIINFTSFQLLTFFKINFVKCVLCNQRRIWPLRAICFAHR